MKWFTAENINHWALTADARAHTPKLVEELIRATSGKIDAIRFLGGPSSQLRGFDGILDAEGAPPYVPEGLSVWEFGAGNGDMVAKATEDLEKRSKDTRGVKPKDTTFVFVTPRNWDHPKLSREEWASDRPESRLWKAIKIYDSIVLEGWLDQTPVVASRFAKHLGRRPVGGVWTVDEFWEEFSANFDFTIKEKLLLCERDTLAKELLDQLANGPQAVKIRGDSEDEIAAFAAAAIREADPDVRAYLQDRTLIVDTEDAAMHVQSMGVLSVILRRQAVQRGAQLQQRHPTLIPFGADQPIKGLSALERPSARAFQDALEASGKPSREAGQMAYRCGRSITVLARTNPAGVPKRPKWASSGRDLIPALLACSWDGAKPGDREVMQKFSRETYDAYEQRIVHWPAAEDPPFEKAGAVWKLLAPADALAQLSNHISDADLNLLESTAREVFAEIDPDISRPTGDLVSRSGRRKYSDWLRRGLVTSLLQLNYFSKRLNYGASRDAGAIVADLLKTLPGITDDYNLIVSLSGELSYLAEAAPQSFLTALERLLEGHEGLSRQFFDGRQYTGVLWALEVLAWSPDLFGRVCNLLAAYAAIDPGGHLINRPINSLRGMFLAWRPATNATLAQRMAVLDQLRSSRSDVAWQLLELLLPRSHDSASDAPRPRFEEFGASDREKVTHGLVARSSHQIVERALEDAGAQPERWKAIIGHMAAMEPTSLELTLSKLAELPNSLDGEQRALVWSSLRDEVNRHRRFQDARWAMHATILDRLSAIGDKLAPNESSQRIAWLFNDQFPDLGERGRSAIELADTTRAEALKGLLDDGGITAVLRLAETVKFPNLVGRALFASRPEAGDDVEAFAMWNESSEKLRAMAVGYSQMRERRDQQTWIDAVIALAKQGKISQPSLVEHAINWQDSLALWQSLQAASVAAATAFWSSTNWAFARTLDEAEYATDALLAVGRGVTALAIQHEQLKALRSESIVSAIRGALDQISANPDQSEQLTDHFLQEAFAELRTRADLDENEIAELEWRSLPLLNWGQSAPLFLHQRLANDPQFFFEALQLIYRPKDEERETTPAEDARASHAYRMLMHFETVPGASGTEIDYTSLKSWIDKLREIGAATNYSEVTDAYIGQILAHAVADPTDDAWPHQVVRRLIDELSSSGIEKGLRIERYNMRGVVTKAIGEGGDQERALAADYRHWASKASSTPRTASMLMSIAAQWDTEGKESDEQAAQDRLRFSL